MSIGSKLRRKERRAKERVVSEIKQGWAGTQFHVYDFYEGTINCPVQFSSLNSVPTTTACVPMAPKGKKMSYCDDCECEYSDKRPVETQQREYLLSRLSESLHTKDRDAHSTFHLNDDAKPSDGEELVNRIKSGKFVLDLDVIKAAKDGEVFYNHIGSLLGISWRDPAVPADKDGYTAFEKKLNKSFQDTRDTINIVSPADGLAALKAFESSTIN